MQPPATLLARIEWFARCPGDLVTELAGRCDLRRLDKDDVVYASGAAADAFFVLVDGRVGAWRDAEVETESMLYFIADRPGTTLCIENVVAQIPYFATMRSLDRDTQVLSVPAEVLAAALDADPALGLDIARHIARRLQAFTEELTDLGTLAVARRVAKYLAVRADPHSGVVELPISQAELASRLGASRQSVSGALSSLAQRGIVTALGRGVYQVEDADALRALARNPRPAPVERSS